MITRVDITGQHIELTPEIKKYVNKKLVSLTNTFPKKPARVPTPK
jgi:ribosome-associated translation inhibitor RaiA